ncbi:MAG TPA: hypothetical protein VGL02_19220 [Streptomyces sp.]
MAVAVTWAGATYLNVVRVHPDGTTYPVRGAYPATASTTGSTTTIYDYEAPLDVAVSYLVMAPNVPRATATSNTVTLASGGNVWLGHAGDATLNRIVAIKRQPERLRRLDRGVFAIIGRPKAVVVTSGVRQDPAGELTVYTDSATETADMLALLADGSPLLLRTPPGYGWDPLTWIAVGDVVEVPWRDFDGDDGRREFRLPYVEVDSPTTVSGAA